MLEPKSFVAATTAGEDKECLYTFFLFLDLISSKQCVQTAAELSLLILFPVSTLEANMFKGSKFVQRIYSKFSTSLLCVI